VDSDDDLPSLEECYGSTSGTFKRALHGPTMSDEVVIFDEIEVITLALHTYTDHVATNWQYQKVFNHSRIGWGKIP
jgi:hypothetical protein